MNVVAELIQQCIAENARIAQNQADYEKRYNALAERFDKAKARLDKVEDGIVAKQAHREMMQNLVDYVTVYGRDDVRFTFKNGMEIKA